MPTKIIFCAIIYFIFIFYRFHKIVGLTYPLSINNSNWMHWRRQLFYPYKKCFFYPHKKVFFYPDKKVFFYPDKKSVFLSWQKSIFVSWQKVFFIMSPENATYCIRSLVLAALHRIFDHATKSRFKYSVTVFSSSSFFFLN